MKGHNRLISVSFQPLKKACTKQYGKSEFATRHLTDIKKMLLFVTKQITKKSKSDDFKLKGS